MAHIEVYLPAMGEGIIEATLSRWLKKKGEFVAKDEPIVEVSTDKVDSEIVSPNEGILVFTAFNEGDIVPVGQLIAKLESDKSETTPIIETIPPDPKTKYETILDQTNVSKTDNANSDQISLMLHKTN